MQNGLLNSINDIYPKNTLYIFILMFPKSKRKGIILAGGTGSRLFPITLGISKQLMPVYDKPMIYYPLTTLITSGITEILIITNKFYLSSFKSLLSDGKHLGLKITYAIQKSPNGLAEAFIIGEKFLEDSPATLILGDNLFHGDTLYERVSRSFNQKSGATIFVYEVKSPEKYGVVSFNKLKKAIKIEEKPQNPKSKYAITGLYFYDKSVVQKAKTLVPSDRGELEISDLNQLYLNDNSLNVEILGRGSAWLDTGDFDSLHEAGAFIRTIEHRQGLKVGCPEEASWRAGLINSKQLEQLAKPLIKSGYGNYLLDLLKKDI